MMNFTGQVGKSRNINLGGRSTSTISRQSALQKAKEDRLKREQARKEENAANVLLTFFKNRLETVCLAHSISNEWDNKYMHENTDIENVDTMLRMFSFITRTLRTSSPERLARVREAVLVATSKQPPSEDVLKRVTSAVELLLATTESNNLFQSIMAILVQVPQYTSREAFLRIVHHDKSADHELWKTIETLIPYHTPEFVTDLLPIKGLFDYVDGSKVPFKSFRLDEVVETLESFDFAKLCGCISNVFSLLHHRSLNMELLKMLVACLKCLPLKLIDTQTAEDNGYDDDEGTDPFQDDRLAIALEQQGMLQEFNYVYNRDFVQQVFDLVGDGASATTETLITVSSLFVVLNKVIPEKRRDMTMYVLLATNNPIITFWSAFKQSLIFQLVSENVGSAEELRISSTEDKQAYSLLLLTLDLFSFWMVVTDDEEFLSSQNIALQDIIQLTKFLRNLVFSLIWNWYTMFDSHRFVLTPEIEQLKRQAIFVVRQLYIRDTRRNFLEEGFWIMSKFLSLDSALFSFDIDERNPRYDILTEVPFFLPFEFRVGLFQRLVVRDEYNNPFVPHERRQNIRRGHEFEDAFEAYGGEEGSLQQKLYISFITEHGEPEVGIDGGGLTKEFLSSVGTQGFDPNELGLFAETTNHLLYPSPEVSTTLSNVPDVNGDSERKTALQKIRFLGRIVGKCLSSGILMNFEFAPFFLQKCQGRGLKSSFDDLYWLDPQVYATLVKVRQYPGDVERDLNLTFTYGEKELRPNGMNTPVTNSNRLQYIHAVADYRLNVVLAPQTAQFFDGMREMVEPKWLAMFNAPELQMLISGASASIDVQDLKRNTVYGFYNHESTTVKLFWQVVEEMPNDDRKLLLQFVTSTPKAPLGGFKMLSPLFCIHGSRESGNLPTASTCVNLLKLPDYRDKEVLRQKLLYSIRSQAGFDLS